LFKKYKLKVTMRLHFTVELSMGQMMVWNDETQTFNSIWSYWNWIRYCTSFFIETDPSTVSKKINNIVPEGIHKGQHLHHIIVTHELSVSRSNEKTNHFYFGYTCFFSY